ncbi:MAG: DUF134 domain-containing protein [Oscillospiraceae bacterium]
MARPLKPRRICELPITAEFAPCSKPKAEVVELAIDEYEVIRLIDYLGFTQEECSYQMNVARTTVQSIYDSARKKLADTLINGKRLSIRGGSYDVCSYSKKCCGKNCRHRKCDKIQCEKGIVTCRNCTAKE